MTFKKTMKPESMLLMHVALSWFEVLHAFMEDRRKRPTDLSTGESVCGRVRKSSLSGAWYSITCECAGDFVGMSEDLPASVVTDGLDRITLLYFDMLTGDIGGHRDFTYKVGFSDRIWLDCGRFEGEGRLQNLKVIDGLCELLALEWFEGILDYGSIKWKEDLLPYRDAVFTVTIRLFPVKIGKRWSNSRAVFPRAITKDLELTVRSWNKFATRANCLVEKNTEAISILVKRTVEDKMNKLLPRPSLDSYLTPPVTPPSLSPSSSPETSPIPAPKTDFMRLGLSLTAKKGNESIKGSSGSFNKSHPIPTPPDSPNRRPSPSPSWSSNYKPADYQLLKNCYSNDEVLIMGTEGQFSSVLESFDSRVFIPVTTGEDDCPYRRDFLKTRNKNAALNNELRPLIDSQCRPEEKSKLFGTWTDVAPELNQTVRTFVNKNPSEFYDFENCLPERVINFID